MSDFEIKFRIGRHQLTIEMTSRQDQLRRITQSLRRYTKVNTFFGMVPIPVGNLSTLIFPLDRTKENYLLLAAQTNSLEGRIDYEEVNEVTSNVKGIYRSSYRCRLCTYFFVRSFTYLLILLTFAFLISLFLSLVRSAGIENLYILAGYFAGLIALFSLYWCG